jgi:hypothetical protein
MALPQVAERVALPALLPLLAPFALACPAAHARRRAGAFVADIAVKTGKGRSTVARDVTRAKKVAVLDDIAGTCLDKGDEIDALGKLPEGEQRKLATAARAGEWILLARPILTPTCVSRGLMCQRQVIQH